jgi:hypothetical protein
LEVLSLEDYHGMINANLNGAYYCVQAFLPQMRARRSGTIVNIVSDAGKQASPKAGPAYVMSKFLLGHPGGLAGVLAAFLGSALDGLGATEIAVSAGPELERWMFLFPGLMAASWLVMVALNAVLAQALAVRLGVNRRPTPNLSALELPGWLWPAIGTAALLALLGDGGLGFLGRALLIVLTIPYVFLGLAVVHAFARRVTHRRLALGLFYGAMMLLGWPILAVLLLGFVEDWAHVRQRFL